MTLRWITGDEAALLLSTSEGNIRVLAHRLKWQRRRTGRRVAYLLDDVLEAARDIDTPTIPVDESIDRVTECSLVSGAL